MRARQRWEQASGPRTVALFLACYLPASIVTWWTFSSSDLGQAFAAHVGVALVAFLIAPIHRWPLLSVCVLVCHTATGWWIGGVDDLALLVGGAIGVIAQTTAAVAFINASLGRSSSVDRLPDLGRRRDLAYFIAAACLIGPLVGAAVDTLVSWVLLDSLDWTATLHRPIGDALGAVVIAPLFLSWRAPSGRRTATRAGGALFALSLGVATSIALALSNMPVLFLVLGGLVLGGAFFDVRTIAVGAGTIALAIGVAVAIDPEQLMSGMSAASSLTLTKLEFILFALTAYLVAAEGNEHVAVVREALAMQGALAELQRMLLPPMRMEGGGYRVSGTYDPAQRNVGIGGDWYLARVAVNGHLVFAVGDIVGHDLRAGKAMAAVRSGLVLEAATTPDPEYLLDKLDSFSDAEPAIRYSTAWVGVYDPVNRTLDYACAGHPPPLLVANERVYRLDRANSALVGLPQGRRLSTTTFVPPGSAIVMYTDGLVERRSEGVEAGIRRLESLLLSAGTDPDELLDTMLDDSIREDDSAIGVIHFDQVIRSDASDERLQAPTGARRRV